MIPLYRCNWKTMSQTRATHKQTLLTQTATKSNFSVQSSYRCLIVLQTRRSRRVSSGPAGPHRPADDIIPAGPAGPQVLPADGFDRQRDRGDHDTHTAVPVSPPTAVGPPRCDGAADRRVYTESGVRLQCVWCDLFSEKTGGRTVG